MVSQTIVAVSIFNPVLAIIFLPGLMLYSYLIQITTHDEDGDGTIDDDERAPVHYRIGFLIASLFFPATILCVKVTSTCAKSINFIFIKWVQLFISIYLAGRCLIQAHRIHERIQFGNLHYGDRASITYPACIAMLYCFQAS